MVVKTIEALRDFEIHTRMEQIFLAKGEIKRVTFQHEKEFSGHLASGFFVETNKPEFTPIIDIVYPEPEVETITIGNTTDADLNDDLGTEQSEEDTKENQVELQAILDKKEMVIEVQEDGSLQVKEEPMQEPIQELARQSKEKLIEELNKKGPPWICATSNCGRTRRKNKLYCTVCLEGK